MGEHASGAKLILTKQGATYSDDSGRIVKRWLWDPKKQDAGTPPTEPIRIQLNKFMAFEYKDRCVVTVLASRVVGAGL